jgi:hypothetical protein
VDEWKGQTNVSTKWRKSAGAEAKTKLMRGRGPWGSALWLYGFVWLPIGEDLGGGLLGFFWKMMDIRKEKERGTAWMAALEPILGNGKNN